MSRPWSPGPWEIVGGRLLDANGKPVIEYNSAITIAMTSLTAQQKANARIRNLAPALYEVLDRIIADLPTRRDWLDPDIEKIARALLKEAVE